MLAPSRPATPGNAPPPVAADPMPTTNQPAAITAQPRGLRRLPSTTVFSPNCIDSMHGSLALVRSWPPYRVTRLLSGGYQTAAGAAASAGAAAKPARRAVLDA